MIPNPHKIQQLYEDLRAAKTLEEVQKIGGILFWLIRLHAEDKGIHWHEAARDEDGEDIEDETDSAEHWKRPDDEAHEAVQAPFQPGDRVRVNAAGQGTTGAPRSRGLLYVLDCWQNPNALLPGGGKANYLVSIAGKAGLRPHGGKPCGFYNASFFDLVWREPAQRARK